MAVRPIDAVQVLHNINLHHRPTPVSEFESGFNDGLNQAMWEITHAPTLTQPNETPPCYQPDGDGCAYQCYDGDDEPIDKCKECPLCYSDKQRHRTTLNEPLTLEELRKIDTVTPLWVHNLSWGQHKPRIMLVRYVASNYWSCVDFDGFEIVKADDYGSRYLIYRRPPEGEP